MQKELTNVNEIKVFILYVIKNSGEAVSENEIIELIPQAGYIDYFDFTILFGDLLESGNIRCESNENGNFYTVTERGEVIIKNLKQLIPTSLRGKVNSTIARRQKNKIDSSEFECWSELSDDNVFNCKINKNSTELMDFKIKFDSTDVAEQAKANIDANPELFLKGLYTLLTKNINYL